MKKLILLSTLISLYTATWIKAEPDPQAFLKEALGNRALRNGDYGEQYCWYVNYSAGVFLDAYEAYRNPKWLDAAAEFYDAAIANLSTDPDGYPGWIGSPIGGKQGKNAPYLTDTVVGDSILGAHLLRFAEIVNADPALHARFGAKARGYIDLVVRICWDKFEHRGQYYMCSNGYVSYPTYNRMVDADTGKWVEFPSRVVSNNLNKHYDMGVVYTALWRLTGREEFKDRAMRIFARNKAIMRYYPEGDRVVWNFWMPHAPYDIEGSSPKSWVSVHPNRSGYQSGEVAMFVEMYNSGLVYTLEDLQRMVNTNLWMAHNGWKNAEGGPAGQLWPALIRFSPELRKIYEKNLAGRGGVRGEIARDYYRHVTAKNLNNKRLHVKDPSNIQVANPPLQPGVQLAFALPIPNRLELKKKQGIQLACKANNAGELIIELLADDGNTVLKTLETIQMDGGYAAPLWDGAGAREEGVYYIRWTINGESRLERVMVVEGTAGPATDAVPTLQPGRSVKIDFEHPLDERIWTVEDSEISDTRAHGGRKSLEVKRNAVLSFGKKKHKDLPVKVSMWIYDDGAQSRGNANGPAWGILDTLGNKFCMRMVWRGYLNGNQQYSWLNTGENLWFNPHPSGLVRNKGWNQWVFDFSVEPPTVILNGKAFRDAGHGYVPSGAVAVYLLNGNPGGPLYIDDLEIIYPAP